MSDRDEELQDTDEVTRLLADLTRIGTEMTRSFVPEPQPQPEALADQAVVDRLIQAAEEGGAPAVRELGPEQWDLNEAYVATADSGRIQAVEALLEAGAEFDCEKYWAGGPVPRCPVCYRRRYDPEVPDCGHWIAISYDGGYERDCWEALDQKMNELLDLCFDAAYWIEYCWTKLDFDALDEAPKEVYDLLSNLDGYGGAGWFLCMEGAVSWRYDTCGFLCAGCAAEYFHPEGEEFGPKMLEKLRPACHWLMERVEQGKRRAFPSLAPPPPEG